MNERGVDLGRQPTVAGPADFGSAQTLASGTPVDFGSARTVASGTPAPLVSPGQLPRGATVGRYVILDVLGKGGMGIVYAAFDPELDRKVAVKLLHPGSGVGTDAAARLLREGRAIAKLTHPNVVTVHDVGTHDGAIFVAMELVDGSSLDHWIAAEPRPWREVLDVFEQAGAGLIAAHHAGMVHRDFKPANVLMGKDGRVRVTDFGLARFGDRGDDAFPTAPALDTQHPVALTRTGAVMGTPAYMPPEQFEGAAVDAKSDQFSFAVALYEGLYQERPFGGRSLVELSTQISEGLVKAPPANTAVPARLRQVVLRALHPDRNQRYASMEDLLAALERVSRRRSRRYLAAGAAALALAGAAFVLMPREDAALDICGGSATKVMEIWNPVARIQMERAFLATSKPYAGAAFKSVADTFDRYSAAWAAKHHETCAATSVRREQSNEALDLRMSCLDHHLSELAAKVDVLGHADATAVDRALYFAQPAPLTDCDDVAALRDPVALPSNVTIRSEVETVRRQTERAKTLLDAGKTDESAKEIAAAFQRAQVLDFKPLLAETLLTRGHVEVTQGDPNRAEATYREALVAALAGNHQRAIALTAIRLMRVAGIAGTRYDEALRFGDQAAAVIQRVDPGGKIEADLHHFRGGVLLYKGDLEGARVELTQALALYQKLYGPDSLLTTGSLAMLSPVERRTGHPERALEIDTQVIAITEKQFGPVHPDLAAYYGNRANTLEKLRRLSDARESAQHAFSVAEAAYGPEHPETAFSLFALARLENKLDHRDEALELLRRAQAIFAKDPKANQEMIARCATTEAAILYSKGDYTSADEVSARAAAAEEALYPAVHPRRADRQYERARILIRLARLDEARPLLERAIGIWTKLGDSERDFVVDGLIDLARLEHAAGRAPQARVAAQRAVDLARQIHNDTGYASALEQLGALDQASGAFAGARKRFEEALALEEKTYGKDAIDLDVALVGLGQSLRGAGDAVGAAKTFERALSVLAQVPERGPAGQSRALAAFELATLLWSDPASRPRALTLAQLAERSFRGGGALSAPDQKRASRWLASHAPD